MQLVEISSIISAMRRLFTLAIPLVMLAAQLPARPLYKPPAYNAGLPLTCEGRTEVNVGTAYYPQPTLPNSSPVSERPRRLQIMIDAAGQVRINGAVIERAALAGRLATEHSRGPMVATITPAEQTPAESLVDVLRALNQAKQCDMWLSGTQLYQNAFDHKTPKPGRFEIPELAPFAKVTDTLLYVDYVKPVQRSKGKSSETGCRVYYNATESTSKSLTDDMFRRNTNLFMAWRSIGNNAQHRRLFPPELYGGTQITGEEANELNLAPPNIFLNAAIYTKPGTPWMCLAGAMWSAQISGFANADVILAP